ncbi:MAG: hypothetical protein U1E83_04040 [Methylotetracoccus sp.]
MTPRPNRIWPAATLYGTSILLLLGLYVASMRLGIPFGNLTRDPLAVTGGHPLIGIISNLGVLLWCMSATICIFGYAVLGQCAKTRALSGTLLWGGLLSTLLMADDLVQIHERVGPHFGLDEKIVYALYGVLMLIFLARCGPFILRHTRWVQLLAAFLCFGLSLATDLTAGDSSLHFLVEDGSKFLGVGGWFLYFADLAYGQIALSGIGGASQGGA